MNQKQKKQLQELFSKKTSTQFSDLLLTLGDKIPELYEEILHYETINGNAELADDLALKMWSKAFKTIKKINKSYRGYSTKDEKTIIESLAQISEIQQHLSLKNRYKIISQAFEAYQLDEWGFKEHFENIMTQICHEKDDFLLLAKLYEETGYVWDANKAIALYKEHGTELEYLTLRKKHLRLAHDYADLASHLLDKWEDEQALNYAWTGMDRGNGSIETLVSFLGKYYLEKSDLDGLNILFKACIMRKSWVAQSLEYIAEYYLKIDNYEEAKKMLIKALKYKKGTELNSYLLKLKQLLREEDYGQYAPQILEIIKTKDVENYCNILLGQGEKQQLCDFIISFEPWKSSVYHNWTYSHEDLKEFASSLSEEFPQEMSNYFYRLSVYLVEEETGTKAYKRAMKYLKECKKIDLDTLEDLTAWETKIEQLRKRNIRKSSFVQLLNSL
ncbi:hypothetical protein LL14B4_09965 [Lactococcus lactis subsp. lactis]|uniref:Uncharacterized protein n=1 Tax=Lactococcus lactis subsp. lactis TaxID=1360 RepID=A0A2Z3KI53_LACLL|nr:hypothetical protein [Lactococcus lactis]AWN66481.1 hypothetical protein LL14B4_09965 [Lactococcus lactis subsp. lactis]